jgi:aspartate kinase
MCFDEAAELAYFGAKVLHPRTLAPARAAGIPVRVLSTFDVDPGDPTPLSEQGTVIRAECPDEPVRALAIQRQVQSLHLHSLRMMAAPGFLHEVFEVLARHGISVDVIATSEVSVSMTLDPIHEGDLEQAMAELRGFAEVERVPGRSILCLVGAGFRTDTTLLSRIFRVLADEGVPVHVISQGASRINITIVTEPPFGEQAMRALHRELFG